VNGKKGKQSGQVLKPRTPLELMNQKGFLLQMGVEHEIRSKGWVKWGDVTCEHHWVGADDDDEGGFIDIVAASTMTNSRLAIECKKRARQEWFFLVPLKSIPTKRFVALLTRTGDKPVWEEVEVTPESHEAAFCVKEDPMVETIADRFLPATEGYATEESADGPAYFPILVTAATLHIARIDPAKIDLSTGEIDLKNNVAPEEVPMVRFRKGLASTLSTQERQRTILVVQAKDLGTILEDWKWNRYPGSG